LNILYIHQYFKTPNEGGAIRSWYIAKGMLSAGHQVQIITAHNNSKYEQKLIDGLKVHYLPVSYCNNYGFFRRLFSFLFFAHKAYYLSRKFEDIDLAYITSTPLTVGLTALKLKKKKNIPYIFEVRDLWPEAPIQMGIIKSKIIKTISRKLESHIYKNAKKIVALSPGIEDFVKKMVPGKNVLLCPNMADCDFFNQYDPVSDSLKKEHNLGGSFVISYFGAIGWVNALDYYLNLANVCMNKGLDIKFFIIGSGGQESRLIRKAEEMQLDNLFFIGHISKKELKKYLSITDAAYISFANYPILEYNSPNKFFDSLASGKLVVSNVKGWIREIIEDHSCGIYINPEKPEDFIPMITPIMKDSELLKKYQDNARNLAENSFERKKLVQELLTYIES